MADALAGLVDELAGVRRRRQVTQAALGAPLGLSGMSIANWEGGRVPSAWNFVRWAQALRLRLVVLDESGAVWAPSSPVPRASGEQTHLYRLRVLALTLRNVRLEAGMTQEQVAATLGVSTWSVQMWENARRLPRMPWLIEWCAVLGCRLELREC